MGGGQVVTSGTPIGMSIKSTCENLQFSIEKTQITPLQELAPVGSLQLRMVFHGFVAKFYNDSRIFTLIWHSFGVQQTAANHCKPRFFTLQDSSKHCKILQNTANRVFSDQLQRE
jgi:hypothetical protein